MKHLALLIICLSIFAVPLMGDEATHINRGHNQIEIQGLQSIDISPVFDKPTANSIDMATKEDGEILHVGKVPVLTLKDFTNGNVTVQEGVVSLNLGLTKSGGKRIREFTTDNVGKRLAFIINGTLIKAPRVRTPINGEGISINPIEKADADRLARLINSQPK